MSQVHNYPAAFASHELGLSQTRYGFGVSWDARGGRNVDIDLQCVVVDSHGSIIDCAYYNNLKAARAITHSGDEALGKPNHIEEMIWVNLKKLPSNVAMLVFVVAAYSGGSLRDINHGQFHIMEEHESREIGLFGLERSSASVSVVAAMFKKPPDVSNPTGWQLRSLNEMSDQGRHFMDILPQLSGVIRGFLPHAPQRQKVAFAMEKGGVLDLPQGLGQITVGLGWDVDEGECDLDVSAVLMDTNGNDMEAVFFGRLESEQHGIQHTGDNLTGEGDGDDEQIIANLDRIGDSVQQIFFVVNVYTPQRTFSQVAEPFCRVIDNSSGSELCRYSLRDAGSESGLIIAKIAREAGGRWGFHALGLPCRGRTYKDSLPQLRAASKLKTSALMVRSQSSGSLGISSQIDDLAFPPPFQAGAKCCVVM